MHKTVLLAESSDATRSVAETILRQNGFEVIAVTDGDGAMDAIDNVHPDLIVVGSDLTYRDQPVYQLVRQSAGTEKPLLVFAQPGSTPEGIPAEQSIPRPFNPADFLDMVNTAVGRRTGVAAAVGGHNPLGGVNDDHIDAALGTTPAGSIRVTDSEVLNQSRERSSARRRQSEEGGDDHDHTGRVESIVISEHKDDIRRPDDPRAKRPAASSADTGGLDIMTDQYGLTDPSALHDAESGQGLTHDYHWFVNEMQKDASGAAAENPPHGRATPPQVDDLEFTDTASTLEVFNPKDYFEKSKKAQGGGVEKFIDEFKREIEKFQTDEPESLTLREEPAKRAEEPKWEEMVESITPEKVTLFTRQLAADLADRIAERIVEKLDPEKLANLIRSEIMEQLRSGQGR